MSLGNVKLAELMKLSAPEANWTPRMVANPTGGMSIHPADMARLQSYGPVGPNAAGASPGPGLASRVMGQTGAALGKVPAALGRAGGQAVQALGQVPSALSRAGGQAAQALNPLPAVRRAAAGARDAAVSSFMGDPATSYGKRRPAATPQSVGSNDGMWAAMGGRPQVRGPVIPRSTNPRGPSLANGGGFSAMPEAPAPNYTPGPVRGPQSRPGNAVGVGSLARQLAANQGLRVGRNPMDANTAMQFQRNNPNLWARATEMYNNGQTSVPAVRRSAPRPSAPTARPAGAIPNLGGMLAGSTPPVAPDIAGRPRPRFM